MSDEKPDFEITGRHVAFFMCSAFGIIIAVNLLLAFKAVATFPGLETRNSYVVSQRFNAERAAQVALGWEVQAVAEHEELRVTFKTPTGVARPEITSAILGRATSVAADLNPKFIFDGEAFVAPVSLGRGNWNLRLSAISENGTTFRQRIIVKVLP